jgi:glycine cleavage system H protein
MDIAPDRLYSDGHLWVRPGRNGLTIIGISGPGLEEIGEPEYVELPEPGARLNRDEAFAVVETVKAAVELVAPICGTVTRSNRIVEANPALMKDAPYDGGWLVEARLDGPEELDRLMPPESYQSLIAEARPRSASKGLGAEGSNN